MWAVRSEPLANVRATRLVIERAGRPASIADVLAGWQDDAALRTRFDAALGESPYVAFRWELPACTSATVERAFECVLLDSPGLARAPEPAAFAEHFAVDPADVIAFANLGRDALLVVPRPLARDEAYAHLAVFVRSAPAAQRHALWQTVAAAMRGRLGTRPVWLSTAGAGVAWLHVRLDDRPKYYGHDPYRR